MRLRSFYLIIIYLIPFGYSAAQNSIKAKYVLSKKTHIVGLIVTTKYYFAIHKDKEINVAGRLFYGFTFDKDSLATNGYISYDTIQKKIFYIDKVDWLKNPDDIKSFIQTVELKNKTMSTLKRDVAALGHNFKIYTKKSKRKLELNFIYDIRLFPSHKAYFKKFTFTKNLYPDRITMGERGDDIVIILPAIPNW